jgi:uncharacterized protein with gpF-like domain
MMRKIEAQDQKHLANAQGNIPDVLFDEAQFSSGLEDALLFEYPGIFETAGTQLFDELEPNYPQAETQLPKDRIAEIMGERKNFITGASQKIWEDVRDAYLKAREDGLTRDQMAERIEEVFDELTLDRSKLIATTETGAIYGQARHEGMIKAGVAHHSWLCAFDNSRAWHIEAHGQRRPIVEPFIVRGEPMMHPGDPKGSASNVCNCHCVELAA